MKKERQIGLRVGVPAFFALELEDVYRHKEGAHRALAFPDFVGLLVGMGLEQYRKGKALPDAEQEESPEDIEDEDESDTLNLMGIPRASLPDLFREFDEAIKPQEGFRIVQTGGPA
jgi:hypothetical protein